MSKKILLIIVVVAVLYFLYLISGIEIFERPEKLRIEPTKLKLNYTKLMFDDIYTRYNVNTVIKEINSENVEMVVFLSDIVTKKSRILNDNNFTALFSFINGYDTINIECSDVKLLDYNRTQAKNAIALGLDYSGSMFVQFENETLMPYQYLERAVYKFLNLKRSQDIIELVKFGENIDRIGNFSDDLPELRKLLWTRSFDRGGTALLDACQLALNDVSSMNNSYKKAIVAFTDGGENSSITRENDLIQNANRNTIPVFTVGFYSEKEETDFNLLESIANQTGGFFYSTPNLSELAYLYECIDDNLRFSSTVRFTWDTSKFPDNYSQVDLKVLVVEGNKVIGRKVKTNVQI